MHDVRFGSKADICAAKSHVRFGPEADMNKNRKTALRRSLKGRVTPPITRF